MNYYILLEEWSSGVRKFKDEERKLINTTQSGGRERTNTYNDGRAAEDVALYVLDYIRHTKLRQYNLFTQKRGEEFERMLEQSEQRGHSAETVRRFIEDDERWKTTLELADQ
jgi:hypothetical protein